MKSVKCHQCGFVGWADDEPCKRCGAERGSQPVANFQMPSVEPTYQPGYLQQPSFAGHASGDLKKGLAIGSLAFGIIGLFTFGLLGFGAIAGISLGAIALVKAKQRPHEYGGKGMAIAGLITSCISLAVLPIGIIAAIAIPNLMASRMAANEGSTIATLRTIHSAEATYQATAGNGRYGTLDDLVANGLLSQDLARGRKSGYKFTIELKASRLNEAPGFEAVGVPLEYRSTGRRSFYIDETGVIRGGDNRGANATERNPPLEYTGYSSDPSQSYRDPDRAREY